MFGVFREVFFRLAEHKNQIADLQAELDKTDIETTELRQKYGKVADELKRAKLRNDRLLEKYRTLQAHAVSNRSYDQAIRMIKSGAKLGDLVDLCGLSPGEAQLVAAVHQSRLSN